MEIQTSLGGVAEACGHKKPPSFRPSECPSFLLPPRAFLLSHSPGLLRTLSFLKISSHNSLRMLNFLSFFFFLLNFLFWLFFL